MASYIDFIHQLSKYLLDHETDANTILVFNYYLQCFIKTLNASDNSAEIACSIRSIGVFAKLLQRYRKDEYCSLCSKLIEKTLISTSDLKEEKLQTYLSAFLESFSYLVKEIHELNESLIHSVQVLTKSFLINYPNLYYKARYANAISLQSLLYSIYNRKRSLFERMWLDISFKALVLTCSDSYQKQEEKPPTDEDVADIPGHAFNDYLTLWTTLFRPLTMNDDGNQEFLHLLYKIIIDSVFQLVSNLNLNTRHKLGGEKFVLCNKLAPNGDVASLEAENPKDFSLLINLTDFLLIFLKKVKACIHQKYYVEPYIHKIFSFWIEMSYRHPFCSAFYKLTSCILDICKEINFFEGILSPEVKSRSREVFCTLKFREKIQRLVKRPKANLDTLIYL